MICCLRSGGEYGPEHVIRLRDQVAKFSSLPFFALSDVPVPGVDTIPMQHDWPGWWCKMGMFDPSISGDLLYLDLDSSVMGDLSDMANMNRLTIMRDVYRHDGLQSSVMFLPDADRATIWEQWIKSPAAWMQAFHRGGDQSFLESCGLNWSKWQDALPGQVVSYKVHVRKAQRRDREFGNGRLPDGARVVAFHGRPRPWEVGW